MLLELKNEEYSSETVQTDLEKLFNLADEIEQRCENLGKRLLSIRIIIGVILYFALILIIVVSLNYETILLLFFRSVLTSVLAISVTLFGISYLTSSLIKLNYEIWRKKRTEKFAQQEILAVVRELEKSFSKRLSPLEKAYLKIQLSRFDI